MSGEKEIREKIKVIVSTKKITKAMEMVAVTKMRVAQERMNASRPYVERIKQVVNHLTESVVEYSHPFIYDEKKNYDGPVCYIIIASERGLCGGLNVNLFKHTLEHMQQNYQANNVCVAAIGKKAEEFVRKINAPLVGALNIYNERPAITDIISMVRLLEKLYLDGDISKLYVAYNHFGGTGLQVPKVVNILPIINIVSPESTHRCDYLYEPEPGPLLNMLLQRYIDSVIYQSLLENIACEQSARMIAMKNASDNAGEIIEECKLMYNKARQSAITREISEIVSGAAAV